MFDQQKKWLNFGHFFDTILKKLLHEISFFQQTNKRALSIVENPDFDLILLFTKIETLW